MGRLINTTSMTVDGVIDVSGWFVAQGAHDEGPGNRPYEAATVAVRLLEARPFDSGVTPSDTNRSRPMKRPQPISLHP